MRERLIELINTDVECTKDGHGDCSMCEYKYADDKCARFYSEIIADYLLANGVIVPPCKVGDKIFAYIGCGTIIAAIVTRIETTETPSGTERRYFAIGSDSPSVTFNDECIGKTVFLTREAAEEALRGR